MLTWRRLRAWGGSDAGLAQRVGRAAGEEMEQYLHGVAQVHGSVGVEIEEGSVSRAGGFTPPRREGVRGAGEEIPEGAHRVREIDVPILVAVAGPLERDLARIYETVEIAVGEGRPGRHVDEHGEVSSLRFVTTRSARPSPLRSAAVPK